MPHFAKKFVLIKRPAKKGHTWYYRLAGETVHHSTGKKLRREAEEYVETQVLGRLPSDAQRLWDYLEPYWVAETCPHVKRIRGEGKTIADDYIHQQRRRLEMYLKPDKIAQRPIGEISHGELLDFRQRLIDKDVGRRTINKTIQALKTAVKEGFIREDIDRDFTIGIGELKYEKGFSDTFTAKELQAIFVESPGIFRDHVEYTASLAAASTGARRGEILVMQWEQIDFDNKLVHITRALKSKVGEVIGKPKNDKARTAFLPKKLEEALRDLRSASEFILPHNYIFGYADGSLRQVSWWRGVFKRAMLKGGFFTKDETTKKILNPRGLKPHCFRASANTLLLDAGGDPERVRRALGWQDKSTQEIYTNEARLSLDDLRERMDGILG